MTDVFGTYDFNDINNASVDDDDVFERPVLPLQGTVILPGLVTPVTIPGGMALQAAEAALSKGHTVIGTLIRDPFNSTPDTDELHVTGCEIALGRLMPIHEDDFSALAQGRRRVEILAYTQTTPYLVARVRLIHSTHADDDESDVLEQTMLNLFSQMISFNEALPEQLLDYAESIEELGWLTDFLTSTLTISTAERQQLLETTDLKARMRLVAKYLTRELNILELRDEIDDEVQQEMAHTQREIYLREQMRVIQSELGEFDIYQEDLERIHQQIIEAELPESVHTRAMEELRRLQLIPPMAPEVGVIRTYLDWVVALPWHKASADNLDLRSAQTTLDAEHHGLPKVKDRILEHIAVRKLAQDKMKTPILCFVGPPGVGKTSLGQSIATALGREFVRVSLGGVRDEAEIRGHRRTYIGALPGRVIQTMRRAGTVNPVFMLDEIDKLGADFRGDPAAALLELLDPEQNNAYEDHYLDLPYDLSRVLFITTANDLYPLPDALLDRLEVIEFPGYTEEDKLEIAQQFLIPQQLKAHGIADRNIRFGTDALQAIIRQYTYEAGVRNLNREIGAICRKLARRVAEEKKHPKRINARHVTDFLGPPQYLAMRANDQDSIGVATGMAWTSGGGDVMTIEASLLPGKGNLTLTGQLGDVMQESAQAALSYMRARADDLDVPHDDFENYDIHIHLPEGAIPKDGPSAGITLAAALISVFTECKIRSDFAMTGEITLRGKVLPVGGIKEKVLAARRSQIKNIILPAQNEKDLIDVPGRALRDLNIRFVDDMQQVMDAVLLDAPDYRQRDLNQQDDEDDDSNDTQE